MADEPVPDELRDFILRHLDSVAHLEALLLLRANPDEDWDVARTAKRLYSGEPEIAEVLARLCADGLLTCNEGLYRYRCQSADLATTVDRLAELYARHLIPVTNMIHAKTRRIREFADAFKFRRDRK
jgi:hypothetical protein